MIISTLPEKAKLTTFIEGVDRLDRVCDDVINQQITHVTSSTSVTGSAKKFYKKPTTHHFRVINAPFKSWNISSEYQIMIGICFELLIFSPGVEFEKMFSMSDKALQRVQSYLTSRLYQIKIDSTS